jgi:nitrogenase molybdenum-iron protein NifN
MKAQPKTYVSTTNACKLCKPLGACLAFRGIEGAVPYLHGSQGCATYMRRYIISHFREPMDIASSSLGEKSAIYGGAANLKLGLKNVMTKYNSKLIGVATTCLTETIGDDTPMIINEFRNEFRDLIEAHHSPALINVSTPSYSGTHMEGFHAAVKATVEQLASNTGRGRGVNLTPGLVSPADLRYLHEILEDFGLEGTTLPDYSLSLDGPAQDHYEKVPAGGTPIEKIRDMGGAKAHIEFGRTLNESLSAAGVLEARFGVMRYSMGLPVGLRETDIFFQTLESLASSPTPEKHALERGRLVDAYVDAHKYLFGKKAIIYGEEDLVVGLTAFLSEIGIKPVLCASGGNSGNLSSAIADVARPIVDDTPLVRDNIDFYEMRDLAEELEPDLLIGSSKGYSLSKALGAPLIRVGFPIHDRFGGPRTLHVGYRGAQNLLDTIVNTIIDSRQKSSDIGYTYY